MSKGFCYGLWSVRRTIPTVALKVMSVIVSLRWVQRSIILERIQRGAFELSTNKPLVITELVLCISEAFLESPNFPMGMGEVKV